MSNSLNPNSDRGPLARQVRAAAAQQLKCEPHPLYLSAAEENDFTALLTAALPADASCTVIINNKSQVIVGTGGLV